MSSEWLERVVADCKLRCDLQEKLEFYINKGMIDFIPVYNDNRETIANRIEDMLSETDV